MKYLKILFLLILFNLGEAKISFSQNYFYTQLKVPILEYISYSFNQSNNDPYNASAGLFFNAGYSVNIKGNFYTEFGIDYLVRNSVSHKFYDKTDLINPVAEFNAQNSAFAIQLKPIYQPSINSDNTVLLTFGIGVNYQKLYSNGTFTNVINNNRIEEVKNSKSDFHIVLQPEISIIFKTENKIGYRFGLSYSQINWNKALLNFKHNQFTIPTHTSSNLFLSAGFVF